MTSQDTSSPAIRARAAKALVEIIQKDRTFDWVLKNKPALVETPLAKELVLGTLRHVFSLTERVEHYLNRPLRKKDADLKALLLVGAYQLQYAHIPEHAILHETVEAAISLRKPWAKGLINAVLRKLAKEPELPDQSFDHPAWLKDAITAQYPGAWASILAANNTRAPMVLRINTSRTSRNAYRQRLDAEGIASADGPAPQSLVLSTPMPGAELPGWQEGDVAIQDAGAQFAAELTLGDGAAGPSSKLRLLDACAAPGGKLANLQERLEASNTAAKVKAIDISEARITQTRQILERLGHDPDIERGDACNLDWWDAEPFSHILLDAPCSGTGTIRRHPDIKILLTPEAVTTHASVQLGMLNNLWQTLAPAGTLLYCTCSLLSAENDDVIGRFLQHNKDANVQPRKLPSGSATRYGWQLLPTDPNTDGFYYALLRKSDETAEPDV